MSETAFQRIRRMSKVKQSITTDSPALEYVIAAPVSEGHEFVDDFENRHITAQTLEVSSRDIHFDTGIRGAGDSWVQKPVKMTVTGNANDVSDKKKIAEKPMYGSHFVKTNISIEIGKGKDEISAISTALKNYEEESLSHPSCVTFKIIRSTSTSVDTSKCLKFSILSEWKTKAEWLEHKDRNVFKTYKASLDGANAAIVEDSFAQCGVDDLFQEAIPLREVLIRVQNTVGLVLCELGPLFSDIMIKDLSMMIAKATGVEESNQVLTLKGNERLEPTRKLCSYVLPVKGPIKIRVNHITSIDYVMATDVIEEALDMEQHQNRDMYSSKWKVHTLPTTNLNKEGGSLVTENYQFEQTNAYSICVDIRSIIGKKVHTMTLPSSSTLSKALQAIADAKVKIAEFSIDGVASSSINHSHTLQSISHGKEHITLRMKPKNLDALASNLDNSSTLLEDSDVHDDFAMRHSMGSMPVGARTLQENINISELAVSASNKKTVISRGSTTKRYTHEIDEGTDHYHDEVLLEGVGTLQPPMNIAKHDHLRYSFIDSVSE